MVKKESTQKKKTLGNTIARIAFRLLIVIAVLIFIYAFYEKIDFSGSSFTPKSSKDTTSSSNVPSELKWFDDFKGVENIPNKNTKKQKDSSGGNFLQYEAAKNKK